MGQQVAEGIGRCFAFFWHLCSEEVVLGLSIPLLQVTNTTRGGEVSYLCKKARAKLLIFFLVDSYISLVSFDHIIHFETSKRNNLIIRKTKNCFEIVLKWI